jgi:tripartite-type tricarboxylate transporter receptor subunit TctC
MNTILLRWMACLSMAVSAPALAQPAYPNKPIRLVVAFNAGGIADAVARAIGEKMSDRLGQRVVIENQGGAGGMIASRQVAAAAPDGYTVLVNTPSMVINASMQKRPGYDIAADFLPVIVAASTPNLYAASAAVKAATLADLAKAYRGKTLTYATAGIGSSSHISAQYLFGVLMGMDVTHVPYSGGAPAITAALGGQVDVVSVSAPPGIEHVRAGKLKPLAVASRQRLQALPDVPTVGEAGFADFDDESWVGFFVPARTDAAVIQRLNTVIDAVLHEPAFRDRLAGMGFEALGGTPARFGDYLDAEISKWSRIVKATRITAE